MQTPLYHKINWDNRLIGIRGPKGGAGKVLRLILKKCGDLGHGESLRYGVVAAAGADEVA